jgi:hypothetical protein
MFRVGAKYDSNVEVEYDDVRDRSEEKEDGAGVVSLMAGYQPEYEGAFGFRADYGAYADFHQDLDQYNVFEQMFSVEPQLRSGGFIYSLPLRYVFALEDAVADYHRLTLSPTVTYRLGDRQAVEAYGLVSRISDEDAYEVDEDAVGYGGGIGFLLFSENRSYLRISGEYRNTVYDAEVADYGAEPDTDEREDDIFSASIELNYQLLKALDAYSNYTYIRTSSNCSLYDEDRHIIEGGIALNF